MKTSGFLLFLGLFLSLYSTAQARGRLYISQDSSKQPLLLVNSLETGLNYLILDSKEVQEINVYKDSTAIKKFGERGKNGVVTIQTNEDVRLVRLPALLDKYNLPDSVKKLRVCVNDVLIKQPELLLIDESKVRGINTTALVDWNDITRLSNETVINIMVEKTDL
jgi:ABC-type lipopolysaccharide export system ATPase subunit